MIMGKAVAACFHQGWAGKGVGIKEHFVRGHRSEVNSVLSGLKI